jgi:hypothetical protein
MQRLAASNIAAVIELQLRQKGKKLPEINAFAIHLHDSITHGVTWAENVVESENQLDSASKNNDLVTHKDRSEAKTGIVAASFKVGASFTYVIVFRWFLFGLLNELWFFGLWSGLLWLLLILNLNEKATNWSIKKPRQLCNFFAAAELHIKSTQCHVQ